MISKLVGYILCVTAHTATNRLAPHGIVCKRADSFHFRHQSLMHAELPYSGLIDLPAAVLVLGSFWFLVPTVVACYFITVFYDCQQLALVFNPKCLLHELKRLPCVAVHLENKMFI